MEEIIDRLLGFMPNRTVFFYASGSFLLSVTIRYVNAWLKNVTMLPWMRDENQRIRQQILQGTGRLPEENK